jgi:hypothetical protein
MMNKETLMKRLADASQNKIYPLIIPRNELPLRKVLLTTRYFPTPLHSTIIINDNKDGLHNQPFSYSIVLLIIKNRLWNHVRRQQALLSMTSNEWLNQQQENTIGQSENACNDQPQKVPPSLANNGDVTEQLSISENTQQQSTDNIIATCEWPWFNEEAPKSTLLDSLNEENSNTQDIHQLPQIVHTSSSSNARSSSDLLSHELEDRKRPHYVIENEELEEEEEEEEEPNKTKKLKKSQHEDGDVLCSSPSLNHSNSLHFSLDAPPSPAGPASPPTTTPNSPPVLLSA